jgi:Tfp pilus assembly protein PilV
METVLGLIGLVLFIVGVTGFAALVTFTVIKISPARDKPKQAETTPDAPT